MKYKVTITQRLEYGQDIIGTFQSLMEAQEFIETVFAHFANISIEIEVAE